LRAQVVLRRHPAPDPRFEPAAVAEARRTSLKNLKPGDKALFLGSKYYGAIATILEPSKAGLDHKGRKVIVLSQAFRRLSSFCRIIINPWDV
jgi:hypothetical protein